MTDKHLKIPVIQDSELVFETPFMKIKRDFLQQEGQKPYVYYSLSTFPASVVILPITPEGKLLLIEEYRHPTGQIILSIPGGYMNADEEPLAAARRELIEETGYDAKVLHLLGSAYPYAGISSQKTFYICASAVFKVAEQELEPSEIIRIRLETRKSIKELIASGIPLDATLCTALFFLDSQEEV